MKGFSIATALLIILVICIILNCNFINEAYNQLSDLAKQIETHPCEENSAIINELKIYWKSKISWISLSVSHKEIDNLSNIIDTILVSNESGDRVNLMTNLELLKNSIETIVRLEQFSVKNIL